jgi:hypothetical protein
VYCFLCCCAPLRLYVLLRVEFHRSKLNSAAAQFISAVSGQRMTPLLALRCYVEFHTLRSLVVFTAAPYFIATYLFRVVHNTQCVDDAAALCTPMSYPDALWVGAVTMLRQGYVRHAAHR